MKILMINDHINFDGGGFAVFQFEKDTYEEAGHDVYTFSQAEKKSQKASEKDFIVLEKNNRTIRKFGKFFFSWGVYNALRKVISEIKPDLINVHLVSKYPASVYAALRGYPVIQTLHGPNLFCATGWGCLKVNSRECELGIGLKCYLRKCVSFPTYLLYKTLDINTSSRVKNGVTVFRGPSRQITTTARTLGYKPAEYIPLAVDSELSHVDIDRPKSPPTILFVGSMEIHKGVDILLEAFKIIKGRIPDARLIYAGEGKMLPVLRQRTKNMGFTNDVDFLGFVDHSEIGKIYRQAHVFAAPSIWKEQFGLVGPEALLSGLPCVGSNIGGIPEWLHEGEWGFLVPPRDVCALADRLCLILENDQLRLDFALKGRKFVLKEYSQKICKINILELAEKTSKCV